jgi:glycosyltransferase involved in cell wall biosynthesis
VRDVATLLDHYRRADIFVIATLAEGFPRVIYEAMSQGLPVVATDIGTIKAMLRDRQDTLLVARGSGEALADAVELLLRNVELRRALIRNGYDFAWGRLDVEQPSTQLQRLIVEHLDNATAGRPSRRPKSARHRP